MCGVMEAAMALTALSGVMSAVGQSQQANAQADAMRAQGDQARYQAQVARNAKVTADWQAADALKRGEAEEEKARIKGSLIEGQQIAAFAGQGTELSGSPADLLGDTAASTELDALTIRGNAEREAYTAKLKGAGYAGDATLLDAKGANYDAAGDNIRSSIPLAVATTLVGTAGNVAGKWYQYKNPKLNVTN